MSPRTTNFRDLERELLADPEVREAVKELEPAYQITRLRLMRGMTQKELAERVGTQQPAIARLESGAQLPSWAFLKRVVDALGGVIRIEAAENIGA